MSMLFTWPKWVQLIALLIKWRSQLIIIKLYGVNVNWYSYKKSRRGTVSDFRLVIEYTVFDIVLGRYVDIFIQYTCSNSKYYFSAAARLVSITYFNKPVNSINDFLLTSSKYGSSAMRFNHSRIFGYLAS